MKKMIILAAALISTGAFAEPAVQQCGMPSYTAELEQMGTELFYVSALKSELTNVEKEMILEMAQQVGVSMNSILVDFKRIEGGITYFTLNHELYALVNYYPGDTEVGLIYRISRVRTGSYELIASIGDGEINCH